jgi:SAM-dependent methyltransferase
MPSTYDLVPYTEHAYAESHPDQLEVVLRLSGFAPPGRVWTGAPRVLEVGCGRGGNLLPMACGWPEASFVGIDVSPVQIRDARRVAEATSLRNIRFLEADFAREPLETEPFDFVLCHGVYSWVTAEERRAILAGIARALAPGGVAMVSFNTLPGWYRRLASRDWMSFAVGSPTLALGGGPRDAVRWLHDQISPEHVAARAGLAEVHARVLATDAAYLTHEYLADEHHPVYVSTFLEEASASGLTYAGDALCSESALELLPDDVTSRLPSLDVPGALSLADFVRDTAFRRAVLVRSECAARASFLPPIRLDARAVQGLLVASRLRPRGDAGQSDLESFVCGGVVTQVSGVARRALLALAESAPRALRCDEVARRVGVGIEAVGAALFDLWLAGAGVDLHVREPALAAGVSRSPTANPVARWHALEGGPITNAWHHEVALAEPVVAFVLSRLDGQTDVARLAVAVRDRAAGRLTLEEASHVATASLALLAQSALLVA